MAAYRMKNTCGAPVGLGIGLIIACLSLGADILPVAAENTSNARVSGSDTTGEEDFSAESLNKQINDLDAQIQKLRDQSLELQEKTRAKLQVQLEMLKKQQDSLIPRIEKLRIDSETAWEEIKENIQKAVEDLKHSVDSMKK